MDFGKIESVDDVDWTLPSTDPLTEKYLSQFKSKKTEWFLGAPTWGSRAWLGKIYPKDAKPAEFLHHYAQSFNTIELNTTHYRIPDNDLILSWTKEVGSDFRFCPKFPQTISLRQFGLSDVITIKDWQRALSAFDENLGVSFIQLPPHFDYSMKGDLHRFLENWPKELPLAIEFRHSSWFNEGRILPALVEYLQKKNIGIVITDVAGRRNVLHTSISSPFVLLRFIGNELHPSDFSRAQDWSSRLKEWSQFGLQKFFFFAHEPDDLTCPEFTAYLVELYNRELKTDWRTPLRGNENKQRKFI